MFERGDGFSMGVSACGILRRKYQVSSGALVVSSLFPVQGYLGRNLEIRESMQLLQYIRQTTVKGLAAGRMKASVHHLAIEHVSELVLRGLYPVRQLAWTCRFQELLPFGQGAQLVFDLPRIAPEHRRDRPGGKMLTDHTGACEKLPLSGASVLQLHLQHLSESLRYPRVDPIERNGHPPASVRLQQHPLLRQVVQHCRHEQGIALRLAMNDGGKPRRKIASTKFCGQVFGHV